MNKDPPLHTYPPSVRGWDRFRRGGESRNLTFTIVLGCHDVVTTRGSVVDRPTYLRIHPAGASWRPSISSIVMDERGSIDTSVVGLSSGGITESVFLWF